MVASNEGLQLFLDIIGVFVFALSGALVAVRRGLDMVGVAVLAWIAGLGGGMIRDVFLGDVPPVAISDWRLLATALSAGLLVFFAQPHAAQASPDLPRMRRELVSQSVRTLDAAGLALFSVGGALKAISFGVAPLACVLIGVVTACGGGVLRDVLAGQVPELLRRELYAVPALIGSAIVVVSFESGHLREWIVWASVMLVFVIRMTAVILDLNAPTALRTGDSR